MGRARGASAPDLVEGRWRIEVAVCAQTAGLGPGPGLAVGHAARDCAGPEGVKAARERIEVV
jgi:hypothetical protein